MNKRLMLHAPARITIAICTRNRAATLEPAIQSLLSQLGDGVDLLVVDNSSTDSTPEVLLICARGNPHITIRQEKTIGIAPARNAALRFAVGDWVLFFDDDELAPRYWIQKYRAFFVSHPHPPVAAVGGGCEPQFDCQPPPWYNVERARFYLGTSDFKLTSERTPGAGNCAYHRKTVLQLGGFSNELVRAEDTDLNMRLQKAGHEVWWLAGAPILHLTPVSRTTIGSTVQVAFIEGRAYGRLRLKHCDGIVAREVYRFARLLSAPCYSMALLLLAGVTAPLRQRQVAARTLQRFARSAGMGWQLFIDLVD